MQSRRDRAAQGRPVPPAVRGRPVLPRRLLARARGRARVPALAHPRQGRLRDQGRARLPAPRRLRPARATRAASRGSSATGRTRPRSGCRTTHRLVRRAPVRRLRRDRRGRAIFRTDYAIPRLLISWALGFGEHARIVGPAGAGRRGARAASTRSIERHRGEPFTGRRRGHAARAAEVRGRRDGRAPRAPEAAIRPERFARLVTLASVLIAAGRAGAPAAGRARSASSCRSPQQELREDISVLNVVNFGGGAYVIYAEVLPTRRDRGRPRALLGHVRPPRAAAADRGQRAGRGDRPARPRTSPTACSRRARRSSPRSAHDPVEEGLHDRVADRRRRHRARASSVAVHESRGCSSSSTGRRTRTASPSAWSSRTR